MGRERGRGALEGVHAVGLVLARQAALVALAVGLDVLLVVAAQRLARLRYIMEILQHHKDI